MAYRKTPKSNIVLCLKTKNIVLFFIKKRRRDAYALVRAADLLYSHSGVRRYKWLTTRLHIEATKMQSRERHDSEVGAIIPQSHNHLKQLNHKNYSLWKGNSTKKSFVKLTILLSRYLTRTTINNSA